LCQQVVEIADDARFPEKKARGQRRNMATSFARTALASRGGVLYFAVLNPHIATSLNKSPNPKSCDH